MMIPLADEREKVIVNLVHTYNVLLDITQSVLKAFNINDQHYNILKVLEYSYPKPLSVGEIKDMLVNKRGDLTRLIDKLTAMKLVARETNATNRRVIDVALSEHGKQTLANMDAQLATQRTQQYNLSEEEAKQLNTLLDRLRG
ncbi:MAG: MarR family transcriptional regulator [Deinococcota bacterium]